MCGLVGVAGDTTGVWKDIFSELLMIDSVRGIHSTGVGYVDRFNNKFELIKRPGHPFELFGLDEYKKAMSSGNPVKVIMGHNRYATLGSHTEENAHPFAFKNILGMHNGTLDKFSIKNLHNHEAYGTDSEAIFATINEIGIEKTMEKLSGAWALVWFDKKKTTLNFLRNDKRPLHYCYSEDRCTLIWASEMPMLRYVLDRRNKKIQDDQIYTTTKDQMLSWKIPQGISDKIPQPTQTALEGHKWVFNSQTGPFAWESSKTNGKHTGTGSGIRTSSSLDPWYNYEFHMREFVHKFRPPYKDHLGIVINKDGFNAMVKEGCAFCDKQNVNWGDFIQVLGPYKGYHTPFMCATCFDTEDTYNIAKYAIG